MEKNPEGRKREEGPYRETISETSSDRKRDAFLDLWGTVAGFSGLRVLLCDQFRFARALV
jgi:hypothetical protein